MQKLDEATWVLVRYDLTDSSTTTESARLFSKDYNIFKISPELENVVKHEPLVLRYSSVSLYFNTKNLERVAGRMGDVDYADGVSGNQITPRSANELKQEQPVQLGSKATPKVHLVPVGVTSLQEVELRKPPQQTQLKVPSSQSQKDPNIAAGNSMLEESMGLKAVKDFETSFAVKLITNEISFKPKDGLDSSDKVMYLDLQEAGVEEAQDIEVEDANWFDGDNLIISDHIKGLEMSYQTLGSVGTSQFNPTFAKTSKLSRKKQGNQASGMRDEILGPLYRLCKLKEGESVHDFKVRYAKNNFVPVIYFCCGVWALILAYLGLRAYYVTVAHDADNAWVDSIKSIYNIELYMVSTLQSAVLLSDIASSPQTDMTDQNPMFRSLRSSLLQDCKLYYAEYLAIKAFQTDYGVESEAHSISAVSYLSDGTKTENSQEFELGMKNYYTNCFVLVSLFLTTVTEWVH